MSLHTQTPSAHLVGSINLPDAETVFRTASEHLGAHLKRIPDGEVGERFYWIHFQKAHFDRTTGLSRVGEPGFFLRGHFDTRPFTLDAGVQAADLVFPPLGYASAARESYQTFARLRADGVIAPGTRFQVSLPTPAAVIGSFFVPEHKAAVEPIYERALFAELDQILDDIPHGDLAIQWDTALEFGLLEQAVVYGTTLTAWFDDVFGGVIERALRQVAQVPADVHLGFHLCYGDVEEEHFVQPKDAQLLADVAQAILSRSPRNIDWVHLPVPIDRDDEAYFAPLKAVDWPESTELYLGLVHHEDGIDGAAARIAAARTAVGEFGVATECGFGRGPAERTAPLFDLHAQVVERSL
ncbi:hypothetical protein [Homoserinimonas sp. OAct 916]|uniref:hypothetical protein n=1 Tax=Homoserinimonas sp. OAct 916 TaxID=2211450 RepID=UPI000DBE7934|nr:hypothetical protein [Homoserinimonas sp. OAct 916]